MDIQLDLLRVEEREVLAVFLSDVQKREARVSEVALRNMQNDLARHLDAHRDRARLKVRAGL